MITVEDLQTKGFGELFHQMNVTSGGGSTEPIALTTTNAVPQPIYTKTLNLHNVVTFNLVIVCKQNSTAVGKFSREFTVSRTTGAAILLQEAVPSPDVKTNPNLDINCGVDGNNAVVTVTGVAATVIWSGLIEIIS